MDVVNSDLENINEGVSTTPGVLTRSTAQGVGGFTIFDLVDESRGWISSMDLVDGSRESRRWISWMDLVDESRGWISWIQIS